MFKTSTTPMARTTSAGSSQTLSTALSSPGSHTDRCVPSPNYFSLSVASHLERRDSGAGAKHHGSSTTTSSTRSFHSQSPITIAVDDDNSDFEAFRKQSEATHSFHLGRASLHNPLITSSYAASPKKIVDVTTMSPKVSSGDGTINDGMDVNDESDVACGAADSLRPASSMNAPSFLDMPRHASPASMGGRSPPSQMARSILGRLEDRHPRLSLPGQKTDPLSPRLNHQGSNHPRADTLPSSLEAGPTMIQPSNLRDIMQGMGPQQVLLLDLRVSKQFADSRVRGALNLCLPTTLLKRASFSVQKLMDTFDTQEEKDRFLKWKQCACIVVYDSSSTEKVDAVSGVYTLKKFTNEGWKGRGYILRGGFKAFLKSCPELVDRKSGTESRPSKMNLSLGTSMPAVAPVAGGCDMPTTKTAANPFFSNIRQNQDLIGGVGQIPVKRPADMDEYRFGTLPRWLQAATSPDDRGKRVSEKFHRIEKLEQARMNEALSTKVNYGTPDAKSKSVRIAGFEKGSKNRYNNIWPFEHARVKLKKGPGSSDDYFNASHISSAGSDKAYIASQGPLPTTYEDFWSVVWDYDVRIIVMLTAESEGGQLKCHNYWSDKSFGPYELRPLSERRVSLDSKNKHHRHESTAVGASNVGSVGVRKRALTNTDEMAPILNQPAGSLGSEPPFVIVRKFSLSHANFPSNPMREVTQVHYTSWPDFGAPASPAQVLGLVELCAKLTNEPIIGENVEMRTAPKPGGTKRPVLVHCSAGCGRTGTFCTIDTVLDKIKRQGRENQRSTRRRSTAAVKSPLNTVHESSPSNDNMDFFSTSHNTPLFSRTVSTDTVMTGMGNDEEEEEARAEEGEKAEPEWLLNEDVDLIEKTVSEFREQRISMVQSLKQFVLCYETVLEWMVRQKGDVSGDGADRPRPGGLGHRSESGL